MALAVALQLATRSGAGVTDAGTRALETNRQVMRGFEPARQVHPHQLIARSGRWYLLAWDLDREDWRTFRVHRMTPRTPTGPRLTPREIPGGDAAAFVAARFRGSDGPDAWPCRW